MSKENPKDKIAKLCLQTADDPLLFTEAMYDWGNGELSDSTGPREWQKKILASVRDHLKNPETRFMPKQIAIASGHGIGKALSLDTEVPTPSGTKKWGDLRVGDAVFGKNGSSVSIVGTKHFTQVPMYRVTFDDGSFCDVSSGHLWNVRGRQERRNKLDTWRTLETQEIVNLGVKRLNGIAMASQWEIPIQGVAKFNTKEVPIQPYMLGVWLGDGSRNRGAITSNDIDVIDHLKEIGIDISKGAVMSWNIRKLKAKLKELGVLDKYSYQKSVPVSYMENSAHIRSEVLRGLLDTDGEVAKHGSIVFSSTSYALAKDVMWLARSLGGKAQLHPTVKKPFFNDADGNKKQGRDCWRVTIQMPAGFKCFYISRKQERIKPSEHRYLTRWITAIESLPNADCMCIEVAADDGLYLANDFIVTHNSSLISLFLNWGLSTCIDAKIVVTSNTEAQLIQKTFSEIQTWHRRCITKDWFKPTATSLASVDPGHERTWRADALPWSMQNSEAFAGLHNKGRRIIMIMDEASAIDDVIWEVAEGALTDENTEILWLAFGNPTRASGRFRECFGKHKHRWDTYNIDSRTVEGTNKVLLDEWVRTYGEDSDFVRVRVRGEFPAQADSQFIPSNLIEEALERAPDPTLKDPLVFGVDVARGGSDSSVIAIRRGRDAASIPWVKMKSADTTQVAERVMRLADYYKPDAIFIDGGGVGVGVIDYMRRMKYDVKEVQFGSSPTNDSLYREGMENYANRRAEMYGELKAWLKHGCIPNDRELIEQLSAIEYTYKAVKGVDCILLEAKKDMRARGLPSPDESDALALTLAANVQPSDHTAQYESRTNSTHTSAYNALSREHLAKDFTNGYNPFKR